MSISSIRRSIALLAVLPLISVAGCGEEPTKTTDTDSRHFSTLGEKQEFLERYVTFRRSYEELEFDIAYSDGGDGRVPSPSEWDIRIFAKVPEDEIEDWITGLKAVPDVDAAWLAEIPNLSAIAGDFEWLADGGRVVGVDRKRQIVVCRYISL